jgi:uncharacterized protein (TIGR03086 family)
MTDGRATRPLAGGLALLERAIGYTLGNLRLVPQAALRYRTPCPEWDVGALLAHLHDSFAALQEAIDPGGIGLRPVADHAGRPADLVAELRGQASRLLGAWTVADDDLAAVGGCPVPASIVTSVGAIEIAAHGWDVGRACGNDRSIPPGLAGELLALAPLFVTSTDRPDRFAAPVPVPPDARPGDRLVAFLGRDPG